MEFIDGMSGIMFMNSSLLSFIKSLSIFLWDVTGMLPLNFWHMNFPNSNWYISSICKILSALNIGDT